MLLGALEISSGAGLSGLGCFWDVVVIWGVFEAGDHLVISRSYSTSRINPHPTSEILETERFSVAMCVLPCGVPPRIPAIPYRGVHQWPDGSRRYPTPAQLVEASHRLGRGR